MYVCPYTCRHAYTHNAYIYMQTFLNVTQPSVRNNLQKTDDSLLSSHSNHFNLSFQTSMRIKNLGFHMNDNI